MTRHLTFRVFEKLNAYLCVAPLERGQLGCDFNPSPEFRLPS